VVCFVINVYLSLNVRYLVRVFGGFLFLFGGVVTHIGGTIVISYLFHCYEFFCAPCIDSSKWKCIGEHHSICIKMEMYCIMIMAMIAFEIYCDYWFNFSLRTRSWVNYNLRQVGLLKNIIGTNKTRTHNRKLHFI
jgi:hypothetical protein